MKGRGENRNEGRDRREGEKKGEDDDLVGSDSRRDERRKRNGME